MGNIIFKGETILKRRPTLYDCNAIAELIGKYKERGGEVFEMCEGSLGYGGLILHGEGLRTAVVNEVYLNEWASAHTIRFYNKTPKKYADMLAAV